MSATDKLLVIGVITSAYGIKGWVKVKSFTQPQTNFMDYKVCLIKQGKTWQQAEIAQAKVHGKGLVARFVGCDDRNGAEALAKSQIAIEKQQLPELDADDYYWHQLIGLEVWVDDQWLGHVSHLLETGSNDVLVVKACQGSIDSKERLLPFRPEVILQVDTDAGKILADWDTEF